MRKLIVCLSAMSLMVLVGAGCGGGSLKPGMPENVDMSKDYTPAAGIPGIDPKGAAKAAKASKAASKAAAGAETPKK